MTDRVDDYIKKQPSPQKEICERLREIILRAYPNIREELNGASRRTTAAPTTSSRSKIT
ncbi:MAG: hypothetical protein WBZ42_01220 [Halobacteriota archaeon]